MANGKCRITGNPLTELFNLGEFYVNNFVDKEDIKNGDKVVLKLGIDQSSGLVQLFDSYEPDKMYRTYWYKSSINELMRKQLKDIVDKCTDIVKLEEKDVVCDIASNDGQLLLNYPSNVIRVGVDPCDIALKSSIYQNNGIFLLNNYFSASDYLHYFERAKIITCAAMFYDLDDPLWFLKQVEQCLRPDGIFVLQLSYLPLILDQLSYDGIGEEHLCYYSLNVFKNLLNNTNLEIFDVELNDVNSGSIRIYLCFKDNYDTINNILHTRSVREMRIQSLLCYENSLNLDKISTYLSFVSKINSLRDRLVDLLKSIKESGKSIWVLGASTKGNTILQYCNIDSSLIDGCGERNSDKFGKYTIGTGIPIYSEDIMRKAKPDYVLVLPYTFINTILCREKELLENGTKFIVPLPEIKIY